MKRKRKRHTDRGVSSTPSVILYEVGYPPTPVGYPPPRQVQGGGPEVGFAPSGQGTPSPPPLDLTGVTPPHQAWLGYPPSGPGRGTPPQV